MTVDALFADEYGGSTTTIAQSTFRQRRVPHNPSHYQGFAYKQGSSVGWGRITPSLLASRICTHFSFVKKKVRTCALFGQRMQYNLCTVNSEIFSSVMILSYNFQVG